MKKSEQEFLQIFSNNIETPNSFDSLRDKINLERFEKNKTKQKSFIPKLSLAGCVLVLLIVLIIPTLIVLFGAPKVTSIAIVNESELVIDYEKNCQFIDKGIIIEKKLSNGKTSIVSDDEFVVDYSRFDSGTVGNYYIDVYLKDNPKLRTGYNVNVINDEIVSINLSDSRKIYYKGEKIDKEDLLIEKHLLSGKRKEIKSIEFTIDDSKFNKNQVGIYQIEVVLNSNKSFSLSYEVEVKSLDDLDINGLYGIKDVMHENDSPLVLAMEIKENKVNSHYSEIIIGNKVSTQLIKEVIDGDIVIKDGVHSQKMIYDPFDNKMVISGLMVGEPDLICFKLDENDYLISLEGTLANKKISYIAIDGYLNENTINHLIAIYGGLYLDIDMNIPVTTTVEFKENATIIVGTKPIVNDKKEYIGSFYDDENRLALVINEDTLTVYSGKNPSAYTVQSNTNGDIVIRTGPYDSVYKYITSEDIFEIYSGDGYFIKTLKRYNKKTQAIVKLISNYSSIHEYVVTKGEVFDTSIVTKNEIKVYKVYGYNNNPIYENVTFNGVTFMTIKFIDFISDFYGIYDNYLIIKNAWTAGGNNINNGATYYAEIYKNYERTDIGWLEFNDYTEDRIVTFIWHKENEDIQLKYDYSTSSFIVGEQNYSLNKQPFKEFDFIGDYYSDDGSKIILSEKGTLGIVKYISNENYVIEIQKVYIKSLEEDKVVLWYVYQNSNEEREICIVEVMKIDGIWQFEYDNKLYKMNAETLE